GTWTGSEPAEQLHLERHRKVLVESHTLGRLRGDHDSVVPDGPGIPRAGAGHLFADEPVFDRDDVVRERLLVKEMAELSIKPGPLVISDLEQAVGDAKRV